MTAVDYELVWSEPKTNNGRRTIKIDPALVAELRAHRDRQLEERLAAGSAWVDGDLVFANEIGQPLQPQSVSKQFDKIVRNAGLPRITLHGLRHSCASVALRRGVPAHVVANVLGQTVEVLLSTYRHILEGQEEAAATMLADAFLAQR